MLKEAKTRLKNIAMVGIDHKKVYGMDPQTWIIECLKIYKISNKIINFIMNAMENWRVELMAGGQTRAKVKIQRGFFLEDSLSPLQFVTGIMSLKHQLRKCRRGWATNISKSRKRLVTLCIWMILWYLQKKWIRLETLIPTSRIYSQDIRMEFCIEYL